MTEYTFNSQNNEIDTMALTALKNYCYAQNVEIVNVVRAQKQVVSGILIRLDFTGTKTNLN